MAECIVPNCNEQILKPVPEDLEIRNKWISLLKLSEYRTDSTNICEKHFEEIKTAAMDGIEEELRAEQEDIFNWCRLCMNDQNLIYRISDQVHGLTSIELELSEIIRRCIPLLTLQNADNLSKKICEECFDALKEYYKFREKCINMDKIQRNLKRAPAKDRNMEPDAKKMCKEETQNTMTEDGKQKEIDERFDKVEAELKRMGGIFEVDEETDYADYVEEEEELDEETENIIIEVQSDEEENVKGSTSSKAKGKYKSHSGVLPCQHITGIGGHEFCVVNKFLFEYRLCKDNVRYLKCINHACPAIGRQNLLEGGTYQNTVIVSAHNHPASNDEESRKKMFLHAIKKRTQNFKNMNFKDVYDELCVLEPDMLTKYPLKQVINDICRNELHYKPPQITSFQHLYEKIETDDMQSLHFTLNNKQFYQEKFTADDGSMAVIFANCESIQMVSSSKLMYVDSSFRINSNENFLYYLVTVLVWFEESYYPTMFALINKKSQLIYNQIFSYLRDNLAPNLRPLEIVTDYEANLYYALGETYLDSHIGGSCFYYTQNLYKKICSLQIAKELEVFSHFRNIYHMILMLPLLPVNTIIDGLVNIELQAKELGVEDLTKPIFEYIRNHWMDKVTPELFCVHRLENRINENVIAPFRKLRDFLMLSKGKMQKTQINIVLVIEKLIELENFLQTIYTTPTKKSFARDLSSTQKKNVLRAWHFIETHPKINLNNFFSKVFGYIKCMENQLWIWGFYQYKGDDEAEDELINAANFSIISSEIYEQVVSDHSDYAFPMDDVVLDVVVDQNNGFLVKQDVIEQEIPEVMEETYITDEKYIT